MSLEPRTNLDSVLANARAIVEARAAVPPSDADRDSEYAQVMARLRTVSATVASATIEQTLLLAYARTRLMPPPSYQALAAAAGMSYSGVRQRLTPEVLSAVRDGQQLDQDSAAVQ